MFCEPAHHFFRNHSIGSPCNILEIGVFNGDSIANLADVFPNKTIYGIDPFIEDGYTTDHTGVGKNSFMNAQYANTLENIKNYPNAILFNTTSEDFYNQLTKKQINKMNVSWVLIDGSHHYTDVAIDVKLAIDLIGDKPGGIVFDDVNLSGVGKAYQEFLITYNNKIAPPQDLYGAHPGHIIAHFINYE